MPRITPNHAAVFSIFALPCLASADSSKTTAEKTLWSRVAEKVAKLALFYAISENVFEPVISENAVNWAWRLLEHMTKRMLYQTSVYVHDGQFDALRQKALRYLREYGNGTLTHSQLLRFMHIDTDTFRKVIETLAESEMIRAQPLQKGGLKYFLV